MLTDCYSQVEGCFLSKGSSIDGLLSGDEQTEFAQGVQWKVLLPRSRLTPDVKHQFSITEHSLNSVSKLSQLSFLFL